MKIGKIQFFLTLLLIWTGTAVGAWADTTNPGYYFKLTQKFGSLERPYVEFTYPETDFSGIDDVMVNPEFGIVTKGGKRIPLAKMTRCNEEMTRMNERYGLMQVMKTETGLVSNNKKLSLVTMRYYPTFDGMNEASNLYLTGLWDIDNNGFEAGKDIQVDNVISVFDGYLGYIYGHDNTCELDYNGENHMIRFHSNLPKDFKIDPSFNSNLDIYSHEIPSGAILALLQSFPYNGLRTNATETFEVDKKYFYHDKHERWGFKLFVSRNITVPNGSVNDKEGKKVMNQALVIANRDFYMDINLLRKFTVVSEPNAQYKPKLDIEYIDENYGNNGIEYDIYRQGGNEKERKFIATVDGDNKKVVSWVDETAEEFENYTYWVCWRQKSWPRHSFKERMSTKHVYAWTYQFEKDGADVLLRNMTDLKAMSSYIRQGLAQNPFWKLANDIDFGNTPIEWKSIGTLEHPFKGTFEGNKHQIKVNIKSDKQLQGSLFGVVENSTFRDLKVVGNIETSAKFAAGIAGRSHYTSFNNCEVGVNIHSTVRGDGTHGGFVGVTEDTNQPGYTSFTSCVFNGSINGANTGSCGGFVGWSVGPNGNCSHFNGCLNLGTFGVSGNGSDVFARNQAVVGDNCYYLNDLGGNTHNVKKLTEAEKNVGLSNSFDSNYFVFTPNAYPALKIFHPYYATEGENMCDIYLSGESDFKLTENVYYKDVRLNRSYTRGRRCTMMLPFDLTDGEMDQIGAFYEFASYDPTSGVVVMKPVGPGMVKAHTPYVVEPASSFDEITFTYMTLKPSTDVPDASVAPDHNGLVGTLRPITVPTGAYGYSAGDATYGPARGTFVKAGNGVHLPTFSAYLWLGNAPASARTLQAVFQDADGNVTGIETLERDEERPGVYTIDGRQHKTMQRGVNIVNGKKIMVK